MVEDHIKNNVVRVPAAGGSGKGAYFQQAVGIPQGSVLSGLLCNYFFFGHIEKRLLGDVLDGGVPERPHRPPGGGGARGLSARAVGLERRSDGIGGGSGSQGAGATSSFAPPAGGKRGRPGERERERERERGREREREREREQEGERPPKFARISPACSRLGDAAAPDSDRASRGGVLGVPNGRGGGGSDGNRGPHETPQQQSCRNTANQNGRGHGSYGPVGGPHRGERCRLGGNGDDEQRGRGPAEREESGGESPFPDPEGDCTLLRQVDDFLLESDDGISTSKAKAESFVRVMHDEVKTGDWGFSVHQAKVTR
ncbi:telomerase reverse transcriptase, putative [Ectocarpus siliculosus]|uniref:Telomerase reverse transcriptase n=1 Tax=Ectocarpus siliculosus TaxID=2880 RepID=D7FKS8_ECTSI|nr:telomerase reverse transcriptase, putative [Ectocarpus siliculosus]|eukprot:CBJ34208.1 telomerase reverse transcriptase, putative [Ectocarpus siliculosus]